MAIKVSGTTVVDDSRNLQNLVNLNTSGNVYANTFVGDADQLTNLPASGGSYEATASGTLSDGTTIIVNSDGTISAVSGAENSLGTAVDYDTSSDGGVQFQGQPINVLVDYLSVSGGRIVVVRPEGLVSGVTSPTSERLTAYIGTISGSNISFGSPQDIDISASAADLAVIDSDKFAVVYSAYPYHYSVGKVRICTVSGTSISTGDVYTFESDTITLFVGGGPKVAWDSNSSKLVVAYAGTRYDYDGFARVMSVSGTVVTVENRVAFETSTNLEEDAVIGLHFDTNSNKLVVVYIVDNTAGVRVRIGSVSGTTTTWGSAQTPYQTGSSGFSKSGVYPNIYDQFNNRFYILSSVSSPTTGLPANSWHATVGTISGTSMSFVVEVPLLDSSEFDLDTNTEQVGVAIDPSSGIMLVTNNKDVHQFEYDTSTNTFTRKISMAQNTRNDSNKKGAAYIPSVEKFVHVGELITSSSGTEIQAFTPLTTNVTTENYIGISDGAYANNVAATVQIKGAVDDAQSGLTPGQQYFVQADGSLNTTPASFATVFAGTAIASNKLIVKG
jgi:hypothetical protein